MSQKYYDNDVSAIEYQVAQETQEVNLIAMLKPSFGTEGNQFFFLYGDCISTGIAGFGDTPAAAARDFSSNWYNKKAKAMKS